MFFGMFPNKYIGGSPFLLNGGGLFQMPRCGIYPQNTGNLYGSKQYGIAGIYGYSPTQTQMGRINYYASTLPVVQNNQPPLPNQINRTQDNFVPTTPDAKILNMQLILENAKNEQGVISGFFDKIKGATGIGTSSKKCQKYIDDAKQGKISPDEAYVKIAGYSGRQKTLLNVISGALTAGITLLFLKKGKDSSKIQNIIAGLGIGAAVNSTIHVTDRMTNNIKEDVFESKELMKDAGVGALMGAFGGFIKK